MRVEQLTCNIGAEIHGISIRDGAHDEAAFREIHAALLAHRVIFFRDQDDLTPQIQARFASRMGKLESHPVFNECPDAPGVCQIYKSADRPVDPYECAWHADNTWREIPSKACVLHCLACPEVGGDTIWANMVIAYERLPQHVKELISDLKANHGFVHYMSKIFAPEQIDEMFAKFPDVRHPVVCTHPDTREKVLFLGAWATHFVNYHERGRVRQGQDYSQAGGDLFQYLMSQAQIPEYQVRLKWRPGTVAVWDNCSTQHYAVQDYPPSVRKMHRASIAGSRPAFEA